MQKVLVAFGKALLSQLHFRMLMLTVMPFVLSVAIWGVLLWLGLQPMIDWLHAYFADNNGFKMAGDVLGWFGLGAIKTVIVPLIAMWVLLPLMILTALLFVGTLAMPIIARHVGSRHYPQLEQRKGGTVLGSLWLATYSFFIFAVLWILTLPLSMFPPLTFVVQPLLWGWLTYRVMAYDALADHADASESKAILKRHRCPLLAAGAIWLYVLVFVFTGLWFEHYCLDALAQYRGKGDNSAPMVPVMKDIN